MKKIYLVSVLSLLIMGLVAQPNTIINNNYDEIMMALNATLDENNDIGLKLSNKRIVVGDEEVDVSKTFVQYGITTYQEKEVKVLRYATAVKGDITSISYQRGAVEGKNDVEAKNVSTLYKAISSGEQNYYYNPVTQDIDTDPTLAGQYYWACYTIRFMSTTFNNTQIPLTLSVNGEEKASRSVSLDEVYYNAQNSDYIVKKVYGTGSVSYSGNIGTINSVQATVFDKEDNPVEYKYVDYSVDMIIDNAVTGNFGLVFHKTVDANTNAAFRAYQFNFEIGKENNVSLKRNGTAVANTTSTYNFEVGKKYNFRAVTSLAEDGVKDHIECYINNEKVIEIDQDPLDRSGRQCGLRMADAVNNRFLNVKVLNNTKEVTLNHSSYTLNALESFTLIPTAVGIEETDYTWSSSDETVATVSDGKVFGVGKGTTTITATLGNYKATCEVIVNADENYKFNAIYGAGKDKVSNNKGVFTFGVDGMQADLVNADGTDSAFTYYEIELNLYLGCNVGSGANLGFQMNKTKLASGAVSTAYMLKPMTTAQVVTNNVRMVKNGSNTVTNETFELVKGNTYRFKIVSTQVETGLNIKSYIDGTLVSDYTDTTPLTGTIFGLRCGSLLDNNSPHKVSIVSVTKY